VNIRDGRRQGEREAARRAKILKGRRLGVDAKQSKRARNRERDTVLAREKGGVGLRKREK